MSGEKTEKPTARRLEQARQDGQVAKSQDLNAAVVLLASGLLCLAGGEFAFSLLAELMRGLLGQAWTEPFTLSSLGALLQEIGQVPVLILAPFFLGVMAFGVTGNVMQVKPLITFKPLTPNLAKLNPINGSKRLMSMRSVVELAKSFLKMGLVGSIGTSLILLHKEDLFLLAEVPPEVALQQLSGWIAQLTFWVFVAYLGLGVLDWRYQIYQHEKGLRMSKQDIRDENKNLEGDPKMKGQIRQRGQSFLRGKQLKAVPSADVIITNPTHYAVALRYDPDIAPAPHVVAKGTDHLALRIREIATQHKVEVIENRPLARTLFDTVEVGWMIPPELFVAVAEVLAVVYHKRKGRGQRTPRR